MKLAMAVLVLVLFAAVELNGGVPKDSAPQFPLFASADLPFYPGQSEGYSGTVDLQVTVKDGACNVNVTLNNFSPAYIALSGAAIANVKSWKFDKTVSGTFPVQFIYELKGKATEKLENPRVEFDLPVVKLIGKPVKKSKD